MEKKQDGSAKSLWFLPPFSAVGMWKSPRNFCWIICTPHRCEQPERTALELILSALTQESCLAFADAAYCSSRCVHEAPEFL